MAIPSGIENNDSFYSDPAESAMAGQVIQVALMQEICRSIDCKKCVTYYDGWGTEKKSKKGMQEAVAEASKPPEDSTRIFWLYFLAVFLPVAILIGVAMLKLCLVEMHNKRASTVQNEATTLKETLQLIDFWLIAPLQNLYYLSRLPAVTGFLAGRKGSDRNRLIANLMALIELRHHYGQIRLIGGNGRELIRVNNISGKPASTPSTSCRKKVTAIMSRKGWH